MKLKEVKQHIDNFFDNITAEKLYEISVLKYGFSEITVDLENNYFETGKVSYYSSTAESVFNNKKSKADCNIALAA
ncbi:MAG TPA: hypothetical protein GXX42_10970 [Petrimonas sp.]|uniref:Uncharacterized protein n=1 Tax=bioreactor metagenome TaxID=1076179 RepID=A0A645AZP0_9ZZZZ|nr:hypothetical protein [Petrimonas sp.]